MKQFYSKCLVAILLMVSSTGCGEESSDGLITQSTQPQSPEPSNTDNDQYLEKQVKLYFPYIKAGEVIILQEDLNLEIRRSVSFGENDLNHERFIEITIPNRLYEYDLYVEKIEYVDPATERVVTFGDGSVLKSIIPSSYAEDSVSFTVFTHLAKSAYDQIDTIPWGHYENAYKGYLGIDRFLSQVPKSENVFYTSPIHDNVRYGLWIASFSQLAEIHENLSKKLYTNNSDLTVITLLDALIDENIGHSGIFSATGNHGVISLDIQTMRLHLAQGMNQFLKSDSNKTPYTQADINNLNLTDSVTLSNSPLLFESSAGGLYQFSNILPTYTCDVEYTSVIFAVSSSDGIEYECEAISTVGIFLFRGVASIKDIQNSNVVASINLHSNTGFYDGSFQKKINLSAYSAPATFLYEYGIKAKIFIYDNALNFQEYEVHPYKFID